MSFDFTEGYVARQINRYERGMAQAAADERLRIVRLIAGMELADCVCSPEDVLVTNTHRPECMFEHEVEWRIRVVRAIAPAEEASDEAPSSSGASFAGAPTAAGG